MTTAPQPQPSGPTLIPAAPDPLTDASADLGPRPADRLPIGKLLTWAEGHADEDILATAAHMRTALTGLRTRYDADHELSALTTERERLQQRLAEIDARQTELVPPKAKPKKRDPEAAAARTWAKSNGVECPPRGRVPAAVMAAWREATGGTA
ncbi:histone-like nucleoid-structuring protein Lsr2 [Streptomyces sp. NPDC048417]|uniref:Lsr2 family DNA-binding protein n=1 Tax=Streptomyces sp. NPDC048417 TaxID=3155387 RepID=UPI0034121F14